MRYLLIISLFVFTGAFSQSSEIDQLIGAVLGDTPMIQDLQELCDEVGGRPTGSEANLKSVEWGLQKFSEAGVTARKEAFSMPRFWLERSATAMVTGDVNYSPRIVAMTFSIGTPPEGISAPLVDGGSGTAADFERLGDTAKDAFVIIETEELLDIDGLFREYMQAVGVEKKAFAAGATGVIYMSSRPKGLLYRHNASRGPKNTHPMLIMEREEAKRTLRLLRFRQAN